MNEHKVEAVDQMQAYIQAHVEEEITIAMVAKAVGYSQRHCNRIFTELTGKSIAEYIRLIRLTHAAQRLANSEERVLDVALVSSFTSHEGFTKAFSSAFGITPGMYRKQRPPIRHFIPYPVRHQYLLNKGERTMSELKKDVTVCTATVVKRPKRKLIFLPCKQGTDYWSFCQEMGCEWEGLLNSIQEKFDTAAIVQLPRELSPKGCTGCTAGIEVPYDYTGGIPAGYETADLQEGYLLYFQSEPYENEDDFCTAIEQVCKAYEQYDIKRSGYIYDESDPISFHFGATSALGARIAFSVQPVK